MDWLSNNSITITEKSLDYVWEKQKVISENIANISTPGYKTKYVSFEEQLKSNLQKVQSKGNFTSSEYSNAIKNSNITVNETTSEGTRLDGNNVDIDVENIELARVQLQMQYLTRQISSDFSRLQTVIDGR